MNKVIVTKDNFVWLDVTEQMRYGQKKREELWLAHELYVLQDDDSESLLKSHDEIDDALFNGNPIVIEGGFLPSDIVKKLEYAQQIQNLLNKK